MKKEDSHFIRFTLKCQIVIDMRYYFVDRFTILKHTSLIRVWLQFTLPHMTIISAFFHIFYYKNILRCFLFWSLVFSILQCWLKTTVRFREYENKKNQCNFIYMNILFYDRYGSIFIFSSYHSYIFQYLFSFPCKQLASFSFNASPAPET